MMVIDKEIRYLNYGEFGHIVCHCRNQEVIKERRKIEFENDINTDS